MSHKIRNILVKQDWMTSVLNIGSSLEKHDGSVMCRERRENCVIDIQSGTLLKCP